jgi:hypothetical protein
MHAETVLLVHDGKAELFEFNRFLYDGMCPDDNIDPAFFDIAIYRLARLLVHAADEERDIDAERQEELARLEASATSLPSEVDTARAKRDAAALQHAGSLLVHRRQ